MSDELDTRLPDVADPSLAPHDFASETRVIGALLEDPTLLGQARSQLSDADFYFRDFLGAWQAMCDLEDLGETVNLETVVDRMGNPNEVDLGYRFENLVHHAMPGSFAYLVRKLQQVTTRRRLWANLQHNLRAITAGDDTLKVAARVQAGLNTLEAGGSSVKTWAEAAEDLIHEIEGMNERGESLVVPTGVEILDRMFWVKPTDLFIVAGRPTAGKSFLTNLMAREMAKRGWPSLYVTTEMPLADQVARAATGFAVIDREVFRAPTDADRLDRAINAIRRAAPKNAYGTTECNVDQILRSARDMVRRGVIKALFVDYLQKLTTSTGFEREADRLAYCSSALKEFALQNRCPVFLVSSMRRPSVGADEGKQGMSDLRGSGQIEFDADSVLVMVRRDGDLMDWICAKGRAQEDRTTVTVRRRLDRATFEPVEDA